MAKRIMAVDDSASIRQLVSFTLKEAGYDVVEAVDGEDALMKLDGNPVHMMITDLNMPRLDGIGLIKKVREMSVYYKYMPIIMLTTEYHGEKKTEGKTVGATGWIVKPFKPEQLLAVVKKVMG
jgi:two-component system chemotaxis response regulator CheY